MNDKIENEIGDESVQAADLVTYSVRHGLTKPVRTCALCGKNFVLESFTDFSSVCQDCKEICEKINEVPN